MMLLGHHAHLTLRLVGSRVNWAIVQGLLMTLPFPSERQHSCEKHLFLLFPSSTLPCTSIILSFSPTSLPQEAPTWLYQKMVSTLHQKLLLTYKAACFSALSYPQLPPGSSADAPVLALSHPWGQRGHCHRLVAFLRESPR